MARPRFSDDPPPLEREPGPVVHARNTAIDQTGDTLTRKRLPGNTARDLAAPLAYEALREAERALGVLSQGMGDRDERVRHNAARWVLAAAPKMAMLAPPDAAPAATPEERDAALRTALESAEFCELLVRVVAVEGGAARAALLEAGWRAPFPDDD